VCGIAGYRGKPDPFAEERVRRMTAVLARRGPDGDGFYAAPGVVLGHRRLKILDLSDAARQPICDEGERVVVSYNGEIYNYRELRSELQARGHRFASSGDSAVIPAAYVEWGLDFARHLRGMFALAVYDRRDGRLVLARDRVGIKPLYFTRLPDGLVFASEMRAIVAGGWIERSPNAAALRQFLRLGYRTGYATCYDGVEELPPGSLLVVEAPGSAQVRRYWEPPAPESWESSGVVARVREIFDRALDRHLQSDVPVGAHLSGGLDSSTVVSLMARRSDQPVHAFSVYFPDAEWFDERRYSTAAASAAGARQHFVSPTWRQVRDHLDAIVRALDEPVGGPGAIPQYFLNQTIRESGIVVVLGGQGADELFAGYERYRVPHALAAARHLHLGEVAADVRRAGLRRITVDVLKRMLHVDPARMLVPGDVSAAAEAWSWDFERQLRHEFRWYLPMLLHVEDRTSMAWSIESRVPFIDDELIEYVLGLRAGLMIRDGTLKWILREATRGIVPDVILDRKDKRGLPTPLGHWMRGPLRTFVLERLTDRVLLESGLVDAGNLRRLLDAHLSGLRNFDFLLWRPLAVATWLTQAQPSASTSDLAVGIAG
jgi:asparagine synthase (glutamine-hydrolysing)